jgi:hypothetical protein
MTIDNASPFVVWTEPALERMVLQDVTLDVPWSVVERFASFVRLSGSAEERCDHVEGRAVERRSSDGREVCCHRS